MSLQRKTPMKRTGIKRKPVAASPRATRATKRKPRPANPCTWSNRCRTRPRAMVTEDERYCITHARFVADKLVGDFVKNRDDWTCQSCGIVYPPGDERCQYAHVFSRGARYVQYLPENALCLDAKCHQNYTLKPAQWSVWLEINHPGLYTRMVNLEIAGERAGGSVDLAAIIRDFRERAAA